MTNKNKLISSASGRLLLPLFVLVIGFIVIWWGAANDIRFLAATPGVVVMMGMIGSIVGIHRRLPDLSEEKLELLVSSPSYTLLVPLVGAVLAFLIHMTFLAGLLEGIPFPKFEADAGLSAVDLEKFRVIFQTHTTYRGYALLVIWSFVAGYSERFVTDLIGTLIKTNSNP